MKTKVIYSVFILSLLLFAGCKKEDRDPETGRDPEMQLKITGPGVNETFHAYRDYSRGTLHLQPNGKYNFILTLSDEGEAMYLQTRLPGTADGYTVTDVVSAPAAYTTVFSNPFENLYTMRNPGGAAYTSFLIYGSFNTPGTVGFMDDGINIICEGRDSYPNRVFLLIPAHLASFGPYGWIE